MNDIAPMNSSQPLSLRTGERGSRSQVNASTPPTRDVDRIEISQRSQWLSKLKQLPDVRQDLVDRIKEEIAQGSYETPDKIEQAIDELLSDLTA